MYERELSKALIGTIESISGTRIHGITDPGRLGLLEAGGMIRVGPAHYNTLEEIDRFKEALLKVTSS